MELNQISVVIEEAAQSVTRLPSGSYWSEESIENNYQSDVRQKTRLALRQYTIEQARERMVRNNALIAQMREVQRRMEERTRGKRGCVALRQRVEAIIQRLFATESKTLRPRESHELREKKWRASNAVELARRAELRADEHGTSTPGDWISVTGIDYVPPWQSGESPYFDSGGEGLGLVLVERKRFYARSSNWYPTNASNMYLVGRNEAGTYFAHPCKGYSVKSALAWIWQDREKTIIQRQGDIALAAWSGNRKWRDNLPSGHQVDGEHIIHNTHPSISIPQNGQTIIIARRAVARAGSATRD